MPAALARVVRRCLHALTAETPDAELLRRYARDRDADAFAELVARHGPVVLGVCRRALGHTADAEDAFQATFLVLARNASAVRDPARLPGWLHRVALRAARRAHARRRPALPLRAAAGACTPTDPRDLSWREGLAVLDEELNALPDRLRAPLVLCYLDGLTRDEATVRLGWSLAMLKRRLEEGRTRLRERLVRRGVSAAVLAAAASQTDGLRAAVPPDLLARTTAVPTRTASDAACALAHGLGARPFPGSVAVAVVLGLVLTGLAAAGLLTRSADPPPAKPPAPVGDSAKADNEKPPPRSLEPALPTSATARLGSLRFRLPDGSNASALSADGKLLATAHKTTVAVFDTETGERKYILRDCGIPDGFGAGKVALSPDGSLLAHLSETEARLRIWDLAAGKPVAGIGGIPAPRGGGVVVGGAAPPRPDRASFSHFAFTGDGKELVLCGPGGARFVEARTGKEVRKTDWSAEPQFVSPDGRFCLTAPSRRSVSAVTLRETATGKAWPEFTFTPTGESYGNNVALSADGKRAAYVAGPGTVHAWDPTTGKAVAKFEHPKADARDERYLVPAFSTDGRTLLVSTSGTGAIRRYDLESGKELPELTGHLWWVTGVHPLPDGKHLVSASWDGRARRYDLSTGKELPVPDGYDRGASIAGTADGKLFAVAGWNGRLDLFDQTGRLVRNLQAAGTPLQRIAFSPDGRSLAAYDHGGKVRLWNAADGTELAALALPPAGDRRYASALTFSPDGKRLVAAARDDALRCWDLETRKEVWSQATKSDAAAVFTPDGRVLLTGGWDEMLTWRDPGAGGAGRRVAVATATGQTGGMNVNSIAFAPDGRTFLTTHHDFAVRRWDTESGKLLDTWKGHRDVTWWAKFSPDGKWAASGSVDKSVRVWDVATGTELARLDGHDAWVMDGVWGANGSTLLTTAGSDVLLWSLRPPDLKAPADVASMWDDLAAEPAKAYRAQWALIADAKAAAKLLHERQGPEKAPGDAAHIRRLIADLDSDTFRTREQAMKALRDLGKPVVPYLRAARGKASAEAGKRLGELIAEFTQAPTTNDLRQMRAVQILELARTAEAKAVLTEWAAGQPGVLLTDQAADALRRLAARRD